MHKIAKQIRAARLAKGLSQQALADLCGIDRSRISHYESGRHTPSIEQLTKIAAILGPFTIG